VFFILTMFSLRMKASVVARPMSIGRQAIAARQFQTRARMSARKDTQDRESMNVDSNEYSKSGGDGATARTNDVAFSRGETRPEEAMDKAGKETDGTNVRHWPIGMGLISRTMVKFAKWYTDTTPAVQQSNPLDASPANTDLGKPTGPTKEGSQAEEGKGESGRARTSGGGSAPKNG
jgi:hypothetical protein